MHTEMRQFDKIPLRVLLSRSNDQKAMWLGLAHLLVSVIVGKINYMAIHMKYSEAKHNSEADKF